MIEEFSPSVEVTAVGYFKRFLLDESYEFKGHTHNDTWELNIFIKGGNEITCGKSVFVAQEMQAILIPPGTFHACGSSNSKKCDKLVIEFKAIGFDMDETVPFYQFNIGNEILSLVRLLMNEANEHSNMNSNGTLGVLSGMGKKLVEIILQQLMRMENKPEYSLDNDSLIYHKAVKFMEDNVSRNLSVDEVAKAAGVCITLIKRTFSKFTGKGVNAYFTDMKMNVAKEMLIGGKSCLEVSEALGFSSQAYFSRCFKKNTGTLPSKYEV